MVEPVMVEVRSTRTLRPLVGMRARSVRADTRPVVERRGEFRLAGVLGQIRGHGVWREESAEDGEHM
jgi:hypothetical protein